MRPPIAALSLSLALLAASSGCAAWHAIFGSHGVDLTNAQIKTMRVDIRKPVKTICPRERVQMAVFADVVLDGDKEVKHLETWQGEGNVDKTDHLDFPELAFQSDQGRFEATTGIFTPNPDVRATLGHEFDIETTFKRKPELSFTVSYKPDYACFTHTVVDGRSGASGSSGSPGAPGASGSDGDSSTPGGGGGGGGDGTPGGDGGDGAPGAHIAVVATYVRTAFYDKLLALRIGGDAEDFVLVPEGQRFTLSASGGSGGAGGSGGPGGRGGDGGSGNGGGAGGGGGDGASGGRGGNGGRGGVVELRIDARFPEIADVLSVDVAGGAAGPGGSGGTGGDGGSGGSGLSPSQAGAPPAQSGARGGSGSQGASGPSGRAGEDGHATIQKLDVRPSFAGIKGIALL